jgi:histone acetyltransferase SAS3
VQKILDSKQKKNRGAIKPKKKAPPLIIEDEPPHYPPLPSSQLFYFERDETKKHYGGILSDGEAENSKTIPGVADRERFEASRQKAEDDWKKKMTDTDNIPEPTKPSQKMSGPPSKIKCINFGGYEIDTWNTAPYPEEYSRNKIIYICEFCLKYMNSDFVAWRHKVSGSPREFPANNGS